MNLNRLVRAFSECNAFPNMSTLSYSEKFISSSYVTIVCLPYDQFSQLLFLDQSPYQQLTALLCFLYCNPSTSRSVGIVRSRTQTMEFNPSTIALRVVEGDKKETCCLWGGGDYWAILSTGEHK
jgi:hypothetical protein